MALPTSSLIPTGNERISGGDSTRLVYYSDEPQEYTLNQETDAHTAMTRGLAEYIGQLSNDVPGGRQFVFNQVFSTWAEPEDESNYPSAAVYAETPGQYENSKLVPHIQNPLKVDINLSSSYIVQPCEMMLDITLDVWAADPEQRKGLVSMLETELNPVDWRYGLLLELPHYFNERASYEMMSMEYVDDADAAQRRIRRAKFIIRGRVPVTRALSAPRALIRARVKSTQIEAFGNKKQGIIRGK